MKFLVPIMVFALSACGASTQLDERSRAVHVAQTLGAPDSPEPAVDLSNYRLGPADEIAVSVFGAPELDREGAIDAAGSFSLPLVGSVSAAGKTPQELANAIQDKLRGRYLKNPSVTINVKEAKAQTVTVDGEVKEPGVYPIVGRMTLQQAVATAKGASEAAAIENVIVFRTVDGQKMAAMFNLRDIRSGRYPDPAIYGNDIVVVGENATRRFLKDITGFIPGLATFVPVL
jgi:polysaccharide export outer membrane protein